MCETETFDNIDAMANNGWNWDFDEINHSDAGSICSQYPFYGTGSNKGLTKTFSFAGTVTLEYGHCTSKGFTMIELDGVQIGSSATTTTGNWRGGDPNSTIKVFDVKRGSVLTIKDAGYGEGDAYQGVAVVAVKSLKHCHFPPRNFDFKGSNLLFGKNMQRGHKIHFIKLDMFFPIG